MKINNIKFKSLILLLASVFLVSCEDYLDISNPNAITVNDFWNNDKDALYAVNAVYSSMTGQGAGNRTRDCYSRTDEYTSYYGWAEAKNFLQGNIETGSGYDFGFISLPFGAIYSGVYNANQAIENIPNIDMDETLKKRYIAEVRFIRAYHYFNAVILYGNVPYADRILSFQSEGYPAKTIEDLWILIESDLDYAKEWLPVVYENTNDLGRVTSGAATALLARSYMQQKRWGDAKSELQELITGSKYSGVYSLVSNWSDNFTDINENNSESVFEIQLIGYLSAVNGNTTTPWSRVCSPVGWSANEATAGIVKEFELSANYYNNGDADPRRDMTFIWPGMDSAIVMYGDVYADLVQRDDVLNWKGDAIENHQWVRKNLDDYHKVTEDDWSGINTRVIRWADVLLMYAEALNNTGATAEAYQYINEVRARVGINPLTASNLLADLAQTELAEHGFTIPGSEQEKMQLQIEYERIWELTGEGTRWLDLARWGYFDSQNKIDILRYNDTNFDDFTIGRNHLLPFPEVEVDNNPGLEQNFGY